MLLENELSLLKDCEYNPITGNRVLPVEGHPGTIWYWSNHTFYQGARAGPEKDHSWICDKNGYEECY